MRKLIRNIMTFVGINAIKEKDEDERRACSRKVVEKMVEGDTNAFI